MIGLIWEGITHPNHMLSICHNIYSILAPCDDCRNSAHDAGVGTIFDRVLTELVAKMREMKMDKTELAALKAIVLFNPGKLTIGSILI